MNARKKKSWGKEEKKGVENRASYFHIAIFISDQERQVFPILHRHYQQVFDILFHSRFCDIHFLLLIAILFRQSVIALDCRSLFSLLAPLLNF